MSAQNGNNSRGVDPTVGDRLVQQIPAMLDALDAAVANPSPDNLQRLRDETDKLMRALGRVLTELKRAQGARKGSDP
jgi:hypothetical protein